MIKYGPKVYTLPAHSPVVEQYVPPRTYDPLEADLRRAQAPGSLILRRQTEGVEIGGLTLGYLEKEEDQKQWARLLGGSFLMTAQTLYDHAENPEAMFRVVSLPELANEHDDFLTPEKYDEIAISMIRKVEKLSRQVAETHANHRYISGKKYFQIARSFGNVGAMLASYPLDLSDVRNQFGAQHIAKVNVEKTYKAIAALSGHLGQEPTLAQLADRGSKFSNYILRENPVNDEVIRMYDASLSEIEQARSRINH